ncbi:hypothetical protein CE91St46_12320 [Eubacteriales bacterium]|nr:tripartite tricarboxylate transporter substrate binding protein [Faecalicatena sp. BF-R-105]GKH50121.1 hypothetical protein CE91St46_12320 [Eubacteriales bacterium]GKH62757.1 hypothetical protein CE91St47_12260 [Eubacteriales bacterium]
MKRTIALALSLAMSILFVAGCGGASSSAAPVSQAAPVSSEAAASGATAADAGKYADYPSKPINYIITASAGGGLDICARMLAPYFQAELGKDAVVTVSNVTGGANWVGWGEMMNAAPDGYTISNIHTPQVYSYLNKSLKNQNTLESFNLLCNCVTDYCLIAVRADDERFADVNDLKSFAEYIKAHADQEFLVALTSKGGADELVMLDFNKTEGITNITGVNHSKGISEAKSAFLGGHVDIYSGKVGDTLAGYKDGTIKVLGVMSNERSKLMPDVPTAIEQGYDIVNGSSRGIVAQPGMDPELKEIIVSALRRAQENPEYLRAMEEAGYEVDYMEGQEYEEYMKAMEAVVIKYADELGYN